MIRPFAAIFPLLALCSACWARAVPENPKLSCASPAFNFGRADTTQTILHDFILKNTGNTTVKILSVKKDCGCTEASAPKLTIDPGHNAPVRVKLNLHGPTRKLKKAIKVETTAGDLMLSIEGHAVETLRVLPSAVLFGTLVYDRHVTKTIELNPIDPNASIEITRVSSTSPFVKVEAPTQTNHARVMLTSRPPLPVGHLRGQVHIETTDSRYPILKVPFSASVVGELAILPNSIPLIEGVNSIRYVVIKPGKTERFKITEVIPPLPAVKYTIIDMADKGYRIRLTNLSATKDLVGHSVIIKTDVPAMPQIAVPFVLARTVRSSTIPAPPPKTADPQQP